MVLGSGSTWPHDFLFLTGFLSDDEADSEGVGVVLSSSASGDCSGMTDRRDSSFSSTKEGGVIISMGFIVVATEDGVDTAKRDVKLSPGADRKDSAGEASNLMSGDDCWNAMFDRLNGKQSSLCVCLVSSSLSHTAKDAVVVLLEACDV